MKYAEVNILNTANLIERAGKHIWNYEIKLRLRNGHKRFLLYFVTAILLGILLHWLVTVIMITSLTVVILLYRRDIKKYYNDLAFYETYNYPDGYKLRYDNKGFFFLTGHEKQFKKNMWSSITYLNFFEKDSILLLYQRNTKQFHFFCKAAFEEGTFKPFIELAEKHVENRYKNENI